MLVRQDGLTQGGESLHRDIPYSTPAAQTTYIAGVGVIVTRKVEKTLLESEIQPSLQS